MASTDSRPLISGFLREPRRAATNDLYHGRFTCHDVQWAGAGTDALVTFTVTAQELADAALGNLLWTDQDVQRGVKPTASPGVPRVLSLSAGYPDPELYTFDASKADAIVTKLLNGERLFLSPLVWNLRPGEFQAYSDEGTRRIYLYSGRVYLPDSHHRHQAIVKAVSTHAEAPNDYPQFLPDKQFKVELYFLSKEDEGNYFFDKNQLTKPTAKSKAYDLTTQDDLSLLAKLMIERTPSLANNVNRVSDRLTDANPQVITLSTLREMMKTFAPTSAFDQSELEGLANVASEFYEMLAHVRPELGQLDPGSRRKVRQDLLVDSAVMMHGYAHLMAQYNEELAREGQKATKKRWQERLTRIAPNTKYSMDEWHGDLFEKDNPLWRQVGVTKPKSGTSGLTISNTGATRGECGRVLKSILTAEARFTDLHLMSAG